MFLIAISVFLITVWLVPLPPASIVPSPATPASAVVSPMVPPKIETPEETKRIQQIEEIERLEPSVYVPRRVQATNARPFQFPTLNNFDIVLH